MSTRRVASWLSGAALIVAALVAGAIVLTPDSVAEVRLWLDAIGGVAAAFAAIVVALLGFNQQRVQAREALLQQASASEAAAARAAEQTRLAERERNLWERRVQVYLDVLRVLNDVPWIGDPEPDAVDAADNGYAGRHADALSELDVYVFAFASSGVLNAFRSYLSAAAGADRRDTEGWFERASSWGAAWSTLVDALRTDLGGPAFAVTDGGRRLPT
jgi:hypothetical protein